MSEPDEFAAVLDAALSRLRRDNAPQLQFDGTPTLMSGGFWAEMWTLSLAPGTHGDLPSRLVLRLAPDAQLAAWEATFQAGVAEQGYPTPKIRAFAFTPATPQRAWCVMDYVGGAPLLAGLSGPRALLALPRLATRLADTLARAAADLHQLDAEPIKAALAQVSTRETGVDALLERYRTRAHEIGHAALQRTIERLEATKPARQPLVPCHGDLHPFNVLSSSTGYVVLDWTNGQIVHPAFDVALTHLLVSNPPLAAPKPLRPILNAAARKIATRFVKTYQALSPHTIDSEAFDWYRTMHSCRILLDLSEWRADGTLDQHRDHPWFALERTLLQGLD